MSRLITFINAGYLIFAFTALYLAHGMHLKAEVISEQAYPNCMAFCKGLGFNGVELIRDVETTIRCTCVKGQDYTEYYYNNLSQVKEFNLNNVFKTGGGQI